MATIKIPPVLRPSVGGEKLLVRLPTGRDVLPYREPMAGAGIQDLGTGGVHRLQELGPGEDHARVAVVEDVRDLLAPQAVVHRGADGAELAHRVAELEALDAVVVDVDAALAKIGDTLTEIYARADTEGISTAAAADALAASRLRQP